MKIENLPRIHDYAYFSDSSKHFQLPFKIIYLMFVLIFLASCTKGEILQVPEKDTCKVSYEFEVDTVQNGLHIKLPALRRIYFYKAGATRMDTIETMIPTCTNFVVNKPYFGTFDLVVCIDVHCNCWKIDYPEKETKVEMDL